MTIQICDKYTTELIEEAGREYFIRTEKATGRQWRWNARPKTTQRVSYVPKNGITVEKLQEAGLKVRVRHFRYAFYPGTKTPILIPSSFRRNSKYAVLPKGGYTHIAIQDANNNYICVSSVCDPRDTFCYNAGVARALERLTETEIAFLGL